MGTPTTSTIEQQQQMNNNSRSSLGHSAGTPTKSIVADTTAAAKDKGAQQQQQQDATTVKDSAAAVPSSAAPDSASDAQQLNGGVSTPMDGALTAAAATLAGLASSIPASAPTPATPTSQPTPGAAPQSDEPAGAVSTTTSTAANSSSTPTTLPTTTTSAVPTSFTTTSTPAAANGTMTTASVVATPSPTPTAATTNTTTSSNSLPPATKAATDKGGLPKAMIKPNVLTHVIDGYVIQEAPDPFPVQRQRYPERDGGDEPPKKRNTTESNSPISPSHQHQQSALQPPQNPSQAGSGGGAASDMGNCEICGKPELRSKMKRKRFCSVDCARAAKQNSTDQVSSPSHNGTNAQTQAAGNGLAPESVTTSSVNPVAPSNIKLERLESMDTTAPQSVPSGFAAATPMETGSATVPATAAAASAEDTPVIMKWTVHEVCEFIKNLPGCSDYAEDFLIQEIDGQALLLLKENHLVNAMGMKLGPALKIVAKVQGLVASTAPEGQQMQ